MFENVPSCPRIYPIVQHADLRVVLRDQQPSKVDENYDRETETKFCLLCICSVFLAGDPAGHLAALLSADGVQLASAHVRLDFDQCQCPVILESAQVSIDPGHKQSARHGKLTSRIRPDQKVSDEIQTAGIQERNAGDICQLLVPGALT